MNAFARPYPSQWQPVQSYIGQMLTRQGQQELGASYGLQPFEVLTLSLERTLVEKVLALVRAGYAPDSITELQAKVRHVYDLHQLLQQPALQEFLKSDGFTHLVADVRADDARNQEFQGDWATRPLTEALVFADVTGTWPQLLTTYQGAFQQLVHGKLPTSTAVATALTMIGSRLRTLK